MSGYAVDTTQLRLPAAGLITGSLVLAHLPSAVGLPCPLRTLTGVPCPFCGTTTALRALGDGNVTRSLAAAPLGIALVLACCYTLVRRLPPTFTIPWPVICGGLGAEWLFELVRFHVL